MSEDEKILPELPPVEPAPAKFPEGHTFSDELLARWTAFPMDAPLIIGPLTRTDLDQLLFSLADMARGIGELQRALIYYSRGKIPEAETLLSNSWNSVVDAETRNRKLFDAIMRSAQTVPEVNHASE